MGATKLDIAPPDSTRPAVVPAGLHPQSPAGPEDTSLDRRPSLSLVTSSAANDSPDKPRLDPIVELQTLLERTSRALEAASSEPQVPPRSVEQARALVEHARELVASQTVRASPPPIRIAEDGSWFITSEGNGVDCRRRRLLCVLLRELIRARIETPGEFVSSARLIELAWKGERMRPESARNRLRVSMSTLRRLGLGRALIGGRNGYRLRREAVLAACPTEMRD